MSELEEKTFSKHIRYQVGKQLESVETTTVERGNTAIVRGGIHDADSPSKEIRSSSRPATSNHTTSSKGHALESRQSSDTDYSKIRLDLRSLRREIPCPASGRASAAGKFLHKRSSRTVKPDRGLSKQTRNSMQASEPMHHPSSAPVTSNTQSDDPNPSNGYTLRRGGPANIHTFSSQPQGSGPPKPRRNRKWVGLGDLPNRRRLANVTPEIPEPSSTELPVGILMILLGILFFVFLRCLSRRQSHRQNHKAETIEPEGHDYRYAQIAPTL